MTQATEGWSERLATPPAEIPDAGLSPLLAPGETPTAESWREQRADLRRRWTRLLGQAPARPEDLTPTALERVDLPACRATVYVQPTVGGRRQRVVLLEPKEPAGSPPPAALVPFYQPDTMVGFDFNAWQPLTERPVVQFGRQLAEQGYVVACCQAFPYHEAPADLTGKGLDAWRVAAEHLLAEYPRWTGMGKLTSDARLALDLLFAEAEVDRRRVVVAGHSLGGKIAFYTGALDDRIKAVVASDFGIGWGFTNWSDIWYHGPKVSEPDFPRAHHELLALLAPRAFLLVAGDVDGARSWPYLTAARPVYELHGRTTACGLFDHGTGHTPTEESLRAAWSWLAEQFDLPPRDWSLKVAV